MSRRIPDVTEFGSYSEGLLRIKLGHAEREILLSDGTRIYTGDTVIELNLCSYRYRPSKIAFLAEHAWGAVEHGD